MKKEKATVVQSPPVCPGIPPIEVCILGENVEVAGTHNVCVHIPVNPDPRHCLFDTYQTKEPAGIDVEIRSRTTTALEITIGNHRVGDTAKPSWEYLTLCLSKGRKPGTFRVTLRKPGRSTREQTLVTSQPVNPPETPPAKKQA